MRSSLAVGETAWIFGYGSLIWRPSFPYAERRPSVLDGWVRRFWQGSTDHRGLPGAPGRVVTLVREASGQCRGIAYRLEARTAVRVLAELDVREKGGYARLEVDVRIDGIEQATTAITYVARPGNPNYLGSAPLDELAQQVRRSRGPSGANVEYVLRLAEALRELDATDAHVFELERMLID